MVREHGLPDERPEATLLHSKEDKILHRNEEHESKSSRTPSPKLDSDIFTDSLNTSPQPLEVKAQTPPPSTNYLFREVRQNFQKKLAEKFSQTFYGRKLFPSSSQVFDRQMETESHSNVKKHTEFGRNYDFTESKTVDIGDPLGVNDSKEETGEIHFYDSIYGSIEEDKSDSLLINSSYDWNKSLTELDSLEV
ncbi:hypothetical protein RUM43_001501 [Polyplax serrata]|uniref:Uncharacterized protein n=1 Tax=Polyplax serrata TaxID=468196 RepID=A0AAN8SEB9_POLSC